MIFSNEKFRWFLKTIRFWFKGFFLFFQLFLNNKIRFKPDSYVEKQVFFSLNENIYERYLYTFVKNFLEERYFVFFKLNFILLGSLEVYSKYLLLEKNVYFYLYRPKDKLFITHKSKESGIELSCDYFNNNDFDNKSSYTVPMSMHPYILKENLFKKKIENDNVKTINSVFFAGTYGEKYNLLSTMSIFKMKNRNELIEELKLNKHTIFPKTKADFYSNIVDKKVYVVLRNRFGINPDELPSILNRFNYFLCLPGLCMPLSHNIIESMFFGSIPIVHIEYANLFEPKLKHLENAIIFDEKETNINDSINLALNLDNDKISRIRKNVKHYYNNYLSSNAIVNSIVNNKIERIYLNAEYFSLTNECIK